MTSEKVVCVTSLRLSAKGKESLKNTKYYSAEYKLIKPRFEDGIYVADLTRKTGI